MRGADLRRDGDSRRSRPTSGQRGYDLAARRARSWMIAGGDWPPARTQVGRPERRWALVIYHLQTKKKWPINMLSTVMDHGQQLKISG